MRTIVGIGSILATVTALLSTAAAVAVRGTDSAQTMEMRTAPDTLVVVGRVIEIPGTFPPNDLYNYVYVMKYRVLRVERGKFEAKEILVGHYNPRVSRRNVADAMDEKVDGNVEAFEMGAKHRLKLITPISAVWNEAIEDEYFDIESPKYFALRADMVE